MSESTELTCFDEQDFNAIETAVMETDKGRWFLGEFSRRNRVADTKTLLSAIDRLERNITTNAAAQAPDNSELVALAQAIEETRQDIVSVRNDMIADNAAIPADAEVFSHLSENARKIAVDLINTAEAFQLTSASLRETITDSSKLRAIDDYVHALFDGGWRLDVLAQRVSKAMGLLEHLDHHIKALSGEEERSDRAIWQKEPGGISIPAALTAENLKYFAGDDDLFALGPPAAPTRTERTLEIVADKPSEVVAPPPGPAQSADADAAALPLASDQSDATPAATPDDALASQDGEPAVVPVTGNDGIAEPVADAESELAAQVSEPAPEPTAGDQAISTPVASTENNHTAEDSDLTPEITAGDQAAITPVAGPENSPAAEDEGPTPEPIAEDPAIISPGASTGHEHTPEASDPSPEPAAEDQGTAEIIAAQDLTHSDHDSSELLADASAPIPASDADVTPEQETEASQAEPTPNVVIIRKGQSTSQPDPIDGDDQIADPSAGSDVDEISAASAPESTNDDAGHAAATLLSELAEDAPEMPVPAVEPFAAQPLEQEPQIDVTVPEDQGDTDDVMGAFEDVAAAMPQTPDTSGLSPQPPEDEDEEKKQRIVVIRRSSSDEAEIPFADYLGIDAATAPDGSDKPAD